MQQRLAALSPAVRDTLTSQLEGAETASVIPLDSLLQSVPNNERAQVVDFLLDVNEFQRVRLGESAELKNQKKALLLNRLAMPVVPERAFTYAGTAPHNRQYPSKIAVKPSYSSSYGSHAVLQIRPAYFDELSPKTGSMDYSALSMVDVELGFRDDEAWLEKLDLVRVHSANISKTGLPGDGGNAWRIRVGANQQHGGCNNCLVGGASGAIGQGFEFGQELAVLALAGAGAFSDDEGFGNAYVEPSLHAVWHPSNTIALSVLGGYRKFVDTGRSDEVIQFDLRLGNSQRWDVRFSYQKHVAETFSFAFARYW